MINILNRNDNDEIGVASNYSTMRFWSTEFIIKEFDKLISNFNTCKIKDNECLKLKPEIIKSYGKYIFINN